MKKLFWKEIETRYRCRILWIIKCDNETITQRSLKINKSDKKTNDTAVLNVSEILFKSTICVLVLTGLHFLFESVKLLCQLRPVIFKEKCTC